MKIKPSEFKPTFGALFLSYLDIVFIICKIFKIDLANYTKYLSIYIIGCIPIYIISNKLSKKYDPIDNSNKFYISILLISLVLMIALLAYK